MSTKKLTVSASSKKSASVETVQSLKERAMDFIAEHGLVFHSNYKRYIGIGAWCDMDAERFSEVNGAIRYSSIVTSDFLTFDEKAIFTLKSLVSGKIPTLRIYMCDGTPRSMTGDMDVFVDGFGALFDSSQKGAVTPKPKAGYEKIADAFKCEASDSTLALVPDSVKTAKTAEGRLRACIDEWSDTCSRPLVVHKWIICECLLHTVCQPRALDPKLLLSFIPQAWYVKAGGSSSYGIGELITQMANGAFCNYLPTVQKTRPSDFHYTPIRHLVSCVCVIARDATDDLLTYWLSASDTDVTTRRSTASGSSSSPKAPKLSVSEILDLLD